jgi:hypothetical protein
MFMYLTVNMYSTRNTQDFFTRVRNSTISIVTHLQHSQDSTVSVRMTFLQSKVHYLCHNSPNPVGNQLSLLEFHNLCQRCTISPPEFHCWLPYQSSTSTVKILSLLLELRQCTTAVTYTFIRKNMFSASCISYSYLSHSASSIFMRMKV